ncbi:MAG: hypothetical protein LBJ48_08200 [Coriobacteriales bacterium]|jgi:hypothetical protein|nr:hypothetical protein [Coriobacteriales bacterium]
MDETLQSIKTPQPSADEQLQPTTDEGQQSASGKEQFAEPDLSGLPRINWGALLMPAVWGPVHGQWITILFYPLWLFADTSLTNAVIFGGLGSGLLSTGGLATILAATVVLGTAAVTFLYASTAGRKAYLRVAERMTLQEYLARERVWTVVCALIALLFIVLATWYNLAVRIPAGV